MTINEDGSTDGGYVIQIPEDKNLSRNAPIPFIGMKKGNAEFSIGGVVELLKIGFENPSGDYSDTTKPRIVLTQEHFAYPEDSYYYRVQD